MSKITLLFLWLVLFLLPASYGSERFVVFGDSLSDIGNSFAATGGAFPPGPLAPPGPLHGHYGQTFDDTNAVFLGRFTDGQNWVDYLPGVADKIHVDISPLKAYLQGPNNCDDNATDFAVGGSTSGNVNVNGLVDVNGMPLSFPVQIKAYLDSLNDCSPMSAADDLCVIWVGANDFAAGINPLKTVSNIKDGIAQLSGVGVKNFVVITIPAISLTPLVKKLDGATILAAQQFVFTANVALEVELSRFALLHGINIDLVDINAIFVPLVYLPSRFGFTNSTDFAYDPIHDNLLASHPDNYVFWDGFHPTTKAHKIAAEFIFKAIFFGSHFHKFLSFR
jgi:phospholipase/lecithinase/hemolysin